MEEAGSRPPTLDDDEELRLALVMNGGVSLAVWMGGVSYEISRVAGRTHPVYQGLQHLLRTRARVDVVSGTSAGGINGAALALSCTYNSSLYPLRDVWLEKGAFDQMLRSPGEADPPSLLDGNGYFLEQMRRAFYRLIDRTPAFSPGERPIDLTLTATRLYGKHRTLLDDIGAVVEDATHRTRFHVTRDADPDPFANPTELVEKLARAARATASFPIAFEPYLCDPAELGDYDASSGNRDKVHLLDGGMLDNKPFHYALAGIRSMRPHRSIRRVLLYVVPDPAVSVRKPDNRHEQEDYAPTLAEVGLASLVFIPGAQSISNQLDEIRQQNKTVQRQRGTVVTLLCTNSSDQMKGLAVQLFDTYQRRRMEGAIDYILDQLQLAVGADERLLFGKRTRGWLRAVWLQECLTRRQQTAQSNEDYWVGSIPLHPDDLSVRLDDADPSWNWGLYSIEFLSTIVLEVFRRIQRLRHLTTSPHHDRIDVDIIPIPSSRESPVTDWEAFDEQARRTPPMNGPPGDEGPIVTAGDGGDDDFWFEAWKRASAIEAELYAERRKDSRRIHELARGLFEILGTHRPSPSAVAIRRSVCDWLRNYLQSRPDLSERSAKNARRAGELGQVLIATKATIDSILEAGDLLKGNNGVSTLRAEEILALDELKHMRDFLFDEDRTPTAERIIRRLLTVEVVHYAVSHRPITVDALVELVQVSARQPSVLGGEDIPDQKVAGMQLAHFAAFYKKSWRANDWMIGRLDGIDRLVRVLLNPERLHVLYAGKQVVNGNQTLPASEYVYRIIRTLAVETADTAVRPVLISKWQEDRIRSELDFLDDAGSRVPDSLTISSDALIRRLQMEVLCKEIPEVASAVEEDKIAGGDHTGFAARLARRFALLQPVTPGNPPLSPEDALRMFLANPVGKDRLHREVGSDLFARTLSHALTVVHSATSGERSGLGPMRIVMKLLKLPVWVLYLLANRLLRESRVAAAVSTTILVAGVLMIVGSAVADNLKTIAAVGWSLVFGWLATALIRGRSVVVIIGLLALSVLLSFTNPFAASAVLMMMVLFFVGSWLPSWLTASLVAIVILWWTTGHSGMKAIVDATRSSVSGAPSDVSDIQIQEATLFLRALGSMLFTLAIALFAALSVFGRPQVGGRTFPIGVDPAKVRLELEELERKKQGLARRGDKLTRALRVVEQELKDVKRQLKRQRT